MWFFNDIFRTLTRVSILELRKSNKHYRHISSWGWNVDLKLPFVKGWQYGSVGKGTHCQAWESEFDPCDHICEGELAPTRANIMCIPSPTHTNKHSTVYIVIIYVHHLLYINIVIIMVPWFLPPFLRQVLIRVPGWSGTRSVKQTDLELWFKYWDLDEGSGL